MKQAEIRKNGYKALMDSLRVVGMLRFMQQLDVGSGDYTQDRYQSDDPTFEESRDYVSIDYLTQIPPST